MIKQARDVAVDALLVWERDRTFSNMTLDAQLSSAGLSSTDNAFATRLVYGVIERLLTIDWLLNKNSRLPVKKCHPVVRAVLRTAVYQLVYMEKIPVSAAVNEAVKQVKSMKQAHTAGFVNGVLRTVAREQERLLSSVPKDLKGLSLLYSVPFELLKAWDKAYGRETALALAASANEAPPTVIRVNTLRIDTKAFEKLLTKQGITFESIDLLEGAYRIADASLLKTVSQLDDLYYFQDTASQWACCIFNAQPKDAVLDVCAAPGGKTFTTAMRMCDNGTVYACDVHEHKRRILQERAAMLGMSCVTAFCRDASSPLPSEWVGAFDRVLCDVPCSGYGVIRRRPEIRYKSLSECSALPDLQYRILCESARAVRKGGVLQYSTCTLRPEENEQIVERFLQEHADFIPCVIDHPSLFAATGAPVSHCITLMPHLHGTDGFFIASFRKETF